MRPSSPWVLTHVITQRYTTLTNNGAGIKTQVLQTALQHTKFTQASNLVTFSEYSEAKEAEGQVNSQEKTHCLGSTSPWESKGE